jgi:bifunctional enzyme CysN/CysC
MAWHKGPPLLTYLEQIDVNPVNKVQRGFVIPVQRVCRPNHTFRGFQGQIEQGSISVGDEVTVLPGREKAVVETIYITDVEAETACAGQPVTIRLDRAIDISRGNILTKDANLEISDAFSAVVLWMDNDELVPGRSYLLKCGAKTIPATVMAIKRKIDINTGNHIAASKLHKNEIAICDISLSESIVFDSFEHNKALGGFILIDRISNMTSACGTIRHSLRRSTNVVWKDTDVKPEMRADLKAQKPLTLWFTGLSGSGKTVLANALEKKLFALGLHTMLLDGDNVRHGLNRNLGFEEHDRVENIRRTAEVAKLMNDAGLIVLTAFISPYESDRENAELIIGEPFNLVYVSTPLDVCESRDVKGLYAKARRGEIPNFTGITDIYEPPSKPDLEIDTSGCSVDDAVDMLIGRFFTS